MYNKFLSLFYNWTDWCYQIYWAQGDPGIALNFDNFEALMPSDNAATIAPGTDGSFPQDGANSGSAIARTGINSFNLSEIGTFQVYFNVLVSEAG